MTRAIRPIRNEEQLADALERVSELLDSVPGSPEAEELEVLSLVVHAYEEKQHPIPPPDPIDMLQFLMDQHGLKAKDLVDVFGGSGRTSEILNRQRPLTLAMIRKLSAKFGVSADSFVSEYACAG
jgi:HTH-type transcriptional regulator / antitoxin HigA